MTKKISQKKNEDTYPVFFKESNKASRQAAEVIAPFLIDLINPRSVIDIGCDNGEWLVILKQLGVEKVLGIDSPGFELRRFLLETKEFFALDLRNHFVLPNKFDLALCLEVAEHLPQKRAETFIEDLCRIAPVTLFSAAVPGQGGTEHINLQWPEYWERIFNKNGFIKLDPIRPKIWQDIKVAWYYRQNCFLFISEDVVNRNPKFQKLAKVSEEHKMVLLYQQILETNFSVTYSLKRIPRIIASIISKKFLGQ